MNANPAEIVRAQLHLEAFGYLESPELERFGFGLHKAFAPPPERLGEMDDRTRQALIAFQTYAGIPETGELDEATLATMERPRCGFPDVGEFVLWSTKWPKKDLTYAFQELSPDLTATQQKQAIRDALALWSAVTPLTFTEVTGTPDIVITWAKGTHSVCSAFDGPSGVLAHAYFPPPNGGDIAGDAHFDDDERWTLDGGGIDLVTVAAHEFGHSLGLAHSQVQGALMYPYYGGPAPRLSPDDIAGIQALYGVKTAPEPPPPPPVLPTNEQAAHALHFGYAAYYHKRKDWLDPFDQDVLREVAEWFAAP
jgi:hypothetical protein